MNVQKTIAIWILLVISNSAFADNSDFSYIETAIALPQYTEPGYYFTPVVGVVRIGANLNKNIALETMIGTTISNATSGRFTLRYDSVYGAYLKAKSASGIFGKIGFASANASVSGYGAYAVASGSSASYGIGIQLDLPDATYFVIDYMSYYSAQGITVSGPSAGIGVTF
jgi:hypothetical protein